MERRRFPRVPLLTDAWLLRGEDRLHVRTEDLSRSGLRLRLTDDVLVKGDVVALAVRLPDVERELTLRGRVMWSSGETYGVDLVGLSDEDGEAIEQAIEHAVSEIEAFSSAKTPVRE